MSDRAGHCQVCGKGVESYSRELRPGSGMVGRVRFVRITRAADLPPLRAHPCGHDQPRPVIWPTETPTYPPEG